LVGQNCAFMMSPCLVLASSLVASSYNFVSIGDWGGVGLGGYHEADERAVAKQFTKAAETLNAKFVINTGDNFYYYGVWNTSDPQFNEDFESVFTSDALNVPWYSVLGNHDYGYNPDAQVQYKSPNNNRWVMPARYYTKRVELDPSNYISFIFLDASPCQAAYRGNDETQWDPCGSTYSHPADCKFHENVLAQDCGAQLTWTKKQLAAVPKDDWLIVVNHAPADEIDVEDFVSEFQKAGVDLYMNGHVHDLSYYKIDGKGAYMTTGAGCMVAISESEADEKEALKNGKTFAKGGKIRGVATTSNGTAHQFTQVWEKKVAGFTTHSFSSDFKTLTTNFVDYNGNILYTFDVTKGAAPSPTPSSPTPTPPSPSPSGSCCHYNDASCSAGDVCCKSSCSDPSTCSYTESGCSGHYGQVHKCTWTGGKCVVGSLLMI